MGIEAIRRYLLRLLIVLLCVAAWADLRPLAGAGERRPVAVLDVSASVGKGTPRLPEGVAVQSRWLLVADGWQEVVGGAEAVRLPRGATRLGAALRHAAETNPGADVLLVTDGRGTDGDATAAARQVAATGGRVYTLPPVDPVADVGLEDARLVAAAPRARVRAVVSASTSGRAEIRLVRARETVDSAALDLAPGLLQAVELEDASPPVDGATYQVVLVPAPGTPDDDPFDNRLAVGLRPERRVALFWGLPEARQLPPDQTLVVRSAREPDPAELEGADCVVLANLPWRAIGHAATRALERFVAGGGRLLLLGGPEAYAGGGWAGTPLETRLAPLRVPRREGTGLALVLALDRSGSTRGAPLAHLVDATRRAVLGLTPGERLGVLPFAEEPAATLLAPGVVSSDDEDRRRELLTALDALEARGKTDLPAAVRAAADHVHGIEARTRRVILLTDGDPDNPPSSAALQETARDLRAKGVAFGAFVVGDEEAVARLRRHLAQRPEDVHALEDAAQIAEHLLRRIGKLRGEDERQPTPDALRPHDRTPLDLSGFRPTTFQRVETAADAGARLLVKAAFISAQEIQLPFAAVRRVGAGEVVGLAWGPAFEPRPRRAQALAWLRPWIQQLASAADRGLAAEIEGEALVVGWPAAAARGVVTARTESGASDLVAVRPGLFRGPLPPGAEAGVRVSFDGPGGAERPLRMPSRPDAEHRGAGVDEAALQAIASAGGGRRLGAGEAPPPPVRAPRVPLAPWLLLGACILLVLDRYWAKPDRPAADR